ncbi:MULTISPECIES: RNA polymerase subunit sigma [Streptomyces]|uniref:Sigma-70 family RNA polymerase sigma factor n=1 Tax=Streptomyces lycii TaxID=2654337 RepID=A0ABQ7FEM3_9ACTN|nr:MULTISPECIES: RNA polymerase subunit sigma [Streptomyces]KAF4406129.1 sigma-70 family RNA polymerase sigma factor [Streptomyces lycii]PGH51317.1 RNA polymerase subunit sigma [Streptomyces sp. Ru87]
MTPSDLLTSLRPLLAAEAAAEAYGTGIEAADLEQGVWLRLLERGRETGPLPAPEAAGWLRAAVRTEVRGARRRARREVPLPYDEAPYAVPVGTVSYDGMPYGEVPHDPAPYDTEPGDPAPHEGPAAGGDGPDGGGRGAAVTGWAAVPAVEERVMAAETSRALRRAVRRLPGRCPGLLAAMLSPSDPTYREIAGELGISQGSLGPVRSRCLGCLRRMLAAEVATPELRGKER